MQGFKFLPIFRGFQQEILRVLNAPLSNVDADKQEFRITTGIGASTREVLIIWVPLGYGLGVWSSLCIYVSLRKSAANFIGFGWDSRISVLG